MNKKREITEYDSMYKKLTKSQFISIMENMRMVNAAIAHLAYACQEQKGTGSLQVPLIDHPNKMFRFQVFQNKKNKEQVLQVEVLDKETNH